MYTPSATEIGPNNMAFTLGDMYTLEAIVFGVANDPYMVNEPGSMVRVLATPLMANSMDPLGTGMVMLLLPFCTALVGPATTLVNRDPLPIK